MKNIAFVTSDLKSGGSERVASRLTHLFEGKYNSYYIVFDPSDQSYEISAELVNLDAPPSDSKVRKVLNTFKRANGIKKTVKDKNIDTVMAFTSIANRAMRYAKLGCNTIGACRGFEDLMLHPQDYHKVIASGARMLFNSREAQEYYLGLYPDDRDRCVTIENLIDCEKIEQASQESLLPEHQEFYDTHKVVSTVGILSRHKGHWDLLKSFEILKERVPDAGLCIVGHRGLLESDLKDMVSRNKFANDILLTGYQSNPFKFVAKSQVYALSSISEGFPNALVEAMVVKTPCVATACMTGPCEIMFDEYQRPNPTDEYIVADNGILTPIFDGAIDYDYSHKQRVHEIYADALERMIVDHALASKCVESAYTRAKKDDEEVVANLYFELIESGDK